MRAIPIAVMIVAAVALARAQSPLPPPWAYTVNPPPPAGAKPVPPPADPSPRTIPGSALSLTQQQTRDANNPPDWFPDTHPPMPESVAHGRPKEMRA